MAKTLLRAKKMKCMKMEIKLRVLHSYVHFLSYFRLNVCFSRNSYSCLLSLIRHVKLGRIIFYPWHYLRWYQLHALNVHYISGVSLLCTLGILRWEILPPPFSNYSKINPMSIMSTLSNSEWLSPQRMIKVLCCFSFDWLTGSPGISLNENGSITCRHMLLYWNP